MTTSQGMRPSRFIVFGGAGYVGKYLCQTLAGLYPDSEVIVISRNVSKSMFFLERDNISLVKDTSQIQVTQGVIFNLAYELGLSYAQTRKAARKLVQDIYSCIGRQFEGRIVHTSSIAVHGRSGDIEQVRPMRLSARTRVDLYSDAKAYTERLLYDQSRRRAVPVTCVRVGNVLGPGSTWASKIVTRLLGGQPLISRSGEHPSNATFVGNLVHALICMSVEEMEGDTFKICNFAEFGSVPWSCWCEVLGGQVGRQPVQWGIENPDEVRPSLWEDFRHILRRTGATVVPMLSKCRGTQGMLYRAMGLTSGDLAKRRAKSFVADVYEQSQRYMEYSEYQQARVFLSLVAFGLEGVSRRVIDPLPYSVEDAKASLSNWAKYCEFHRV